MSISHSTLHSTPCHSVGRGSTAGSSADWHVVHRCLTVSCITAVPQPSWPAASPQHQQRLLLQLVQAVAAVAVPVHQKSPVLLHEPLQRGGCSTDSLHAATHLPETDRHWQPGIHNSADSRRGGETQIAGHSCTAKAGAYSAPADQTSQAACADGVHMVAVACSYTTVAWQQCCVAFTVFNGVTTGPHLW